MVITRVNGIDLVDDAALAQAVATSNGALTMSVMAEEGDAPADVTVQLRRLSVVSY